MPYEMGKAIFTFSQKNDKIRLNQIRQNLARNTETKTTGLTLLMSLIHVNFCFTHSNKEKILFDV